MGTVRSIWYIVQATMQRVAVVTIIAATVGLVGYCAACALGYAPWLTLSLTFGPYHVPEAGMAVQLLVCTLFVLLAFYLPTNARVMALENSHRSFHIGMQDVARAYTAAHSRDRDGAFTLSAEFDSIRERMAFLRAHPDLTELEPSVLEVAAQMSHISRELAQVYSDANVARARDFLIQRQQEIDEFNSRIDDAKAIATEMRRWVDRVELDESVAEAQLERLCEELADILPELDDQPARTEPPRQTPDTAPDVPAGVVTLTDRRAAE